MLHPSLRLFVTYTLPRATTGVTCTLPHRGNIDAVAIMHPHSGNVQSSKDAQEQATLHFKNARESLGAILVLAHQPTDDTNQCAPENQRSQGQDQGVAQARPFSVLAIVGGQGSPGFGLGVPAYPAGGSPPAEKLQNPHFRGSARVGLGVRTPGTPLARTLPLALGKASSNVEHQTRARTR